MFVCVLANILIYEEMYKINCRNSGKKVFSQLLFLDCCRMKAFRQRKWDLGESSLRSLIGSFENCSKTSKGWATCFHTFQDYICALILQKNFLFIFVVEVMFLWNSVSHTIGYCKQSYLINQRFSNNFRLIEKISYSVSFQSVFSKLHFIKCRSWYQITDNDDKN